MVYLSASAKRHLVWRGPVLLSFHNQVWSTAKSLGCSNWGINSKNLSLPEPITPRQRRFWKHAQRNSNMMLWEKGFLCLNAILGISDLSTTLTSAPGIPVEAPDLCLCFPTWKVEVAKPATEGLPGLTISCLHTLGYNNKKCMYLCCVL